jgi:hypothetical protein
MVRHPPAPPGRWKRAAAAKVARRGAATNEACGRADPTTPARSVAGRRGRARAAWGWQCRVAGPAGCRSFPWRSARARLAREAKRDQDQVVEIPGFQVWETAGNGTAKADRQRFPASAGLRADKTCIDEFMIRSHQGHRSGTRADSVEKKHRDEPPRRAYASRARGTNKSSDGRFRSFVGTRASGEVALKPVIRLV